MDKIIFFDTVNYPENLINEKFKFENISFVKEPLSLDNIENFSEVEIIAATIFTKFSKEILDKLPNLKLITLLSTGFDNVDLEECKKRNIIVTNVPGYANESVAEHTLALLFTISKRIHICSRELKSYKVNMTKLTGFEVKNKTLGIIGTGAIGLHMAKISKDVGMNVIAFDINKKIDDAKKIGFNYVKFDELIKNSDIISLHIPLNKHTENILNKEQFDKMKNSVIIINTARGKLINSVDLLNALNSKKIDFAGLDVFEEENFDKINPESESITKKIIDHDRVVATPHAAFNTVEAINSLFDITIKNINLFLQGKEVEHRVN